MKNFTIQIFCFILQICWIHSANQVSVEVVSRVRRMIDEECKNDTSLRIKDLKNGTKTCPPDGINFYCYPETIAGTFQQMPCFPVLFNVSVNYEIRECKSDGTWGSRSFRKCKYLQTKQFLQNRMDLYEKRGIQLEEETDKCFTTDNGGCEVFCSSTKEGNITCSCPLFQHLAEDGKSCTDNELPKYDGPTNSPQDVAQCPHLSSGICAFREDGNYAWLGQPHCFIQCTSGVPKCQCCFPKSLFYSEKCDQCLSSPNLDECSKPISTTPAPTPNNTTNVTTESSIEAKAERTTETLGCTHHSAIEYCQGPSGVVGSHGIGRLDKRYYVVCVKGSGKKLRGFCMKCPDGLEWVPVFSKSEPKETNEYTGYCGYPQNYRV